MPEILLFHHALGQTAGFHEFADERARAGTRSMLRICSAAGALPPSKRASRMPPRLASKRSSPGESARRVDCHRI